MKKVKNLVLVCLLICTLSIPTSTFATSGYTYSNQNFFESIISMIFSGNKDDQYWGDKESNNKDWDDYDWDKENKNHWDDWDDWDDKDWDNWDGCLKKGGNCIESIDIWRDWYCGKDKDKGKDNSHKNDYTWNHSKGNSWDKWKWW